MSAARDAGVKVGLAPLAAYLEAQGLCVAKTSQRRAARERSASASK